MSDNGFKERYGLELLRLSDGKIKRGNYLYHFQRMEDKGFVTPGRKTSRMMFREFLAGFITSQVQGKRLLNAIELMGSTPYQRKI